MIFTFWISIVSGSGAKAFTDDPAIRFKDGDTFWLFTNEGEGNMSACFGSRQFRVDCTTIANMNDTCKGKATWARAINGHGPRATWWVKVRDAKGRIGWINGFGQTFFGQDRFSEN